MTDHIRVIVRVRPINEHERGHRAVIVNDTQSLTVDQQGETKRFTFDHVADEAKDQVGSRVRILLRSPPLHGQRWTEPPTLGRAGSGLCSSLGCSIWTRPSLFALVCTREVCSS